jgi:hypothetical protein
MKSACRQISGIPTGWCYDLRNWCRGRSAILRLPVLIYFAYVGYRQYEEPVGYASLFAAINLCIHEGGHLLLRPCGNEFLHVAGGTLAQLGAPLLCMVILLRQGEYFGIPFCLGWLSTNLIGVGVYMADARAQELPLVTAEGAGSSEAVTTHDWAYLFGHFGLMNQDTTIGLWTRAVGTAVMLAALLTGAWMLGLMLFPGKPPLDPMSERRTLLQSRFKV